MNQGLVNLGLGLNVVGISKLSSRLANLVNLGLGLNVLGDHLMERDAFRLLW